MNTDAPQLIRKYIDLKNAHDNEQVLRLFSETAKVTDAGENKVMTGRDEIRSWLEKTVASYKLTSEIVNYFKEGASDYIDVKATGDFAGSPALFRYSFVISDTEILSLHIEYKGGLK